MCNWDSSFALAGGQKYFREQPQVDLKVWKKYLFHQKQVSRYGNKPTQFKSKEMGRMKNAR